MELLEKVEKIREKTGVTYEEAKKALEDCDGDVLDAIVYLENQGKIKEPEVKVFTTKEKPAQSFRAEEEKDERTAEEAFQSTAGKFFDWLGNLLKKSIDSKFIIRKAGGKGLELPVLGLILLLLFVFWLTVPLLIIGLFFDYRYSFRGPIEEASGINSACDKASDVAEAIKKEFKD